MRRLVLGLFGLVLAIPAGALFLVIGGLAVPETRELAADLTLTSVFALFAALLNAEGPDTVWAVAAGAFWALTTALLVLPPVLTALIGAAAGLSSYVWYAGGAGLLTIAIAWFGRASGATLDSADVKLLSLLFLTGAAAGFVYWAVAGREMGPVSDPGSARA
ncbi:hypothetical protein GCM10007036_40400 [Alsobacter metallidurans]|uniref:Uncharacterized protein n=1 Tax=Alsobacter metallidurans TaxID=340221 RepID=A0A917MJC6_9HYPH|nr:hypothetical protein [Alsobacter metallidurans]GGH30053.1 hypothetical protein GCM10007036_40400 [Alsobacter metallidurans]